MKRSVLLIVLVLVLIGAGAGWYFYGRGPQTAQAPAGAPAAGPGGAPQAVPVPVYVVAPKSVPIYREYPGSTRAPNTVEIRAKVTGYITKREFTEGTDVKQGDLLYMIDQRDYQAALDRAKAQLDADTATLTYNQQALRRTTQLANSAYASRDSADKAQSDVGRQTASVALSRAQMRTAELDLGYTIIRSPIDGRVGQAGYNTGTLVSAANTLLTTVVTLDPMYVAFSPSENDLTLINQYRGANAVEISLFRIGETEPKFRGVLDFVNNAVDQSSGTIGMRGTVPNPDKVLLPGQFVRVRLNLGTRNDALLIPQRAVGSDQTGKYVYIVGQDSKLAPRPVTLGATFGDQVVAENGLQAGDQIVTDGIIKMGPGMLVRPIQPPPPGQAPQGQAAPGAPAQK